MPIIVSEKGIKSKIKLGERVAVIENIKYPYFESEKHKKLCKKMNDFYLWAAEKYSYYVRNKLPKKIRLSARKRNLPLTLSMCYTVAHCDEKIISVVLDLSLSDGKNIKKRRFSQLWSVKSADILPLSEFMKRGREVREKIYDFVLGCARKNGDNNAFGYYDDYIKRLEKNFNPKNCFVTPKGLCFFIDAGILSPPKYSSCNFVMGFDLLEDVVNADFLPKSSEKTV